MRSKTSFAAHLFVVGFTASLRGMWCGVNVASMPLPPLPMLSVANLVHSPHWKLKSRNLNSTCYSGWMGTKIEIGGEAMHLRSRDPMRKATPATQKLRCLKNRAPSPPDFQLFSGSHPRIPVQETKTPIGFVGRHIPAGAIPVPGGTRNMTSP